MSTSASTSVSTSQTTTASTIPIPIAYSRGFVTSGVNKPPRGTKVNAAHPLSRGLVGAWVFNECTGTRVDDASRQGNDGTLQNFTAGSEWAATPRGGGVYLDGINDSILIGNKKSLQLETQSICAWVKITNAGGYIYGCRSATIGGGSLWIDAIGRLNFVASNFQSTTWSSSITGGGDGGDEWHFVCAAYNKSKNYIKYYIDGLIDSEGSGPISAAFFHNIEKRIGSRLSFLYPVGGYFDQVLVYNRVLTSSEVYALSKTPYAMYGSELRTAEESFSTSASTSGSTSQSTTASTSVSTTASTSGSTTRSTSQSTSQSTTASTALSTSATTYFAFDDSYDLGVRDVSLEAAIKDVSIIIGIRDVYDFRARRISSS